MNNISKYKTDSVTSQQFKVEKKNRKRFFKKYEDEENLSNGHIKLIKSGIKSYARYYWKKIILNLKVTLQEIKVQI